MEFELYFDYLCPFVYRASLLLANSKDDGWTIWDAPAADRVRGRLAFKAAEAARRQGRFDVFHPALLAARHQARSDIDDVRVIEQVAEDSGLDLERFRLDVDDPSIMQALARDHMQAVAKHGVFGTPTFVFPNGASAYIRLAEAPAGAEAVDLYDRMIGMAADEPRVLEIKRPVRPSPD